MSSEDRRLLDIRSELDWLAKPGKINALAFRLLERVLGYDQLNPLFLDAADRSSGPMEFISCLVENFGFEVKATGPGREACPDDGAVIVAANHPFGGADAITVCDHTLRSRSDTRYLANEFIASVAPVRDVLIEVDVFGTDAAAKRKNLRGLREAGRHLENGGQLVVFPGGEVASWSWREKRVIEPPWPALIGSLARRYRARVVPLFLPGSNSPFFHFIGLIHPFLRSTWLSRELLRRRNSVIELRFGHPIEVNPGDSAEEIVAGIRGAVFGLDGSGGGGEGGKR